MTSYRISRVLLGWQGGVEYFRRTDCARNVSSPSFRGGYDVVKDRKSLWKITKVSYWTYMTLNASPRNLTFLYSLGNVYISDGS